ncbi:hypothetical protein E2C01_054232 [Portunus trituberculatus]|uniref:Uncharacterized protein n=1 Tax=Portunus trituberculatus TaxID=210409 RepID=A0A5B7GUG2_PORTR|nr:hypothetical protein [Portunus trituberculatus]
MEDKMAGLYNWTQQMQKRTSHLQNKTAGLRSITRHHMLSPTEELRQQRRQTKQPYHCGKTNCCSTMYGTRKYAQ